MGFPILIANLAALGRWFMPKPPVPTAARLKTYYKERSVEPEPLVHARRRAQVDRPDVDGMARRIQEAHRARNQGRPRYKRLTCNIVRIRKTARRAQRLLELVGAVPSPC